MNKKYVKIRKFVQKFHFYLVLAAILGAIFISQWHNSHMDAIFARNDTYMVFLDCFWSGNTRFCTMSVWYCMVVIVGSHLGFHIKLILIAKGWQGGVSCVHLLQILLLHHLLYYKIVKNYEMYLKNPTFSFRRPSWMPFLFHTHKKQINYNFLTIWNICNIYGWNLIRKACILHYTDLVL